jgi:hypothetical protein
MSHCQNVGQNDNINISNTSFETVIKFRNLIGSISRINWIQEVIAAVLLVQNVRQLPSTTGCKLQIQPEVATYCGVKNVRLIIHNDTVRLPYNKQFCSRI